MSNTQGLFPIVHRLALSPSTQLLAAQRAAVLMADQHPPDSDYCEVWIAESQLSGRGQHHRTFASPLGGFYTTILIAAPQTLPMDILPLAVGWKCAQLLVAAGCVAINIRWPNDLCIGDKKIGGILCQSVVSAGRCCLLIGVGINTKTRLADFPVNLQPYIATLADSGVHVNHALLLDQFIATMLGLRNAEEVMRCASLAASLDVTKGRIVSAIVDGAAMEGVSEGWGPDGHLRMRQSGVLRELTSATIVKINGQRIRFED